MLLMISTGNPLSIEIDYSLPAERVVRALDQVAEWRGYPSYLRIDNGPGFISQKLEDWAEKPIPTGLMNRSMT